MNNNDKAFAELMELLRTNPNLMKELVFDPMSIQLLLSRAAEGRLDLGVDAAAFLGYVAGPDDGYPIVQCLNGTQALCAKGTRFNLVCSGNTTNK